MKKNTITQKQVNEIMAASEFDIKTIFGKVTVVTAKLPNGFTLVESSACVDPANYDEALGTEICKKRIEDKVWMLEGYLLQNALYEKKFVKSIKEVVSMDKWKLNTIEELEKVIKRAIEKQDEVGVFIEMPGFKEPELIMNPPANLEKKLEYYKATYDENLNHKHAKGISIIGYTL